MYSTCIREIDCFISRLQNREFVGSTKASLETVSLLRQCISQYRWNTANDLIDMLRFIGRRSAQYQRTELVVGNIIRRVLRIIRDEYKSIPEEGTTDVESEGGDYDEQDIKWMPNKTRRDSSSSANHLLELVYNRAISTKLDGLASSSSVGSITTESASSMYNLLEKGQKSAAIALGGYNVSKYALKPRIMQQIAELVDELEMSRTNISTQAYEHVQENETIITLGKSQTVQDFLIHAAKKTKFKVYIAETAPLYDGHLMAHALANAGIEVVLIADAAIGGIMERVNKVIIGCHTVMANGGILAVTGSRLLATCAHHHATPVVVLAAMFKLSPCFPANEELYYEPIHPSTLLPFARFDQPSSLLTTIHDDNFHVLSPYYDYVDPKFVSLFITNDEGHPPSYIYRLLDEYYDSVDNNFE